MLLFFAAFIFAQVNIPKKSEKGMILTKTNEKIYYQNLTYSEGKLKFVNAQNQMQEFLYDASVVEVKENEFLSNQTNVVKSNVNMQRTKLTTDNDIKNYLFNHNDPLYIKGKKLNNLGTGFLIGGATCFAVGGLLNLSKAKTSDEVTNGESKGSSLPLIIGLGGMGAGLIMKLSGSSQMKQAVNNYKTSSIFSKEYLQENLSLVANNKGLGLQLKF